MHLTQTQKRNTHEYCVKCIQIHFQSVNILFPSVISGFTQCSSHLLVSNIQWLRLRNDGVVPISAYHGYAMVLPWYGFTIVIPLFNHYINLYIYIYIPLLYQCYAHHDYAFVIALFYRTVIALLSHVQCNMIPMFFIYFIFRGSWKTPPPGHGISRLSPVWTKRAA